MLMCYRGDYQVIKSDQVAFRYEIIEMLGRGSFGQVKILFKDFYLRKRIFIKSNKRKIF